MILAASVLVTLDRCKGGQDRICTGNSGVAITRDLPLSTWPYRVIGRVFLDRDRPICLFGAL